MMTFFTPQFLEIVGKNRHPSAQRRLGLWIIKMRLCIFRVHSVWKTEFWELFFTFFVNLFLNELIGNESRKWLRLSKRTLHFIVLNIGDAVIISLKHCLGWLKWMELSWHRSDRKILTIQCIIWILTVAFFPTSSNQISTIPLTMHPETQADFTLEHWTEKRALIYFEAFEI